MLTNICQSSSTNRITCPKDQCYGTKAVFFFCFTKFAEFIYFAHKITRGVLAQSPEPEAHDKVLDNNPDRIGSFLRRGENRSTRRKTSRSKDENQQQTYMN